MTASSSIETAVADVADLPKLESLGLEFAAIADDTSGVLAGYSIPLTAGLQQDLANVAQATLDRISDSSLLAYAPTVLIPPQHAMHVTVAEAATLQAVENIVDAHDFLPLTREARSTVTVKLLAARFSAPDGRKVTFYRVADSLLQIRKSKLLGLVQQGEVYNRIEPADILLMRAEFEVMVISGHAFFFKKATFERAFGFIEQLQLQSGVTFDEVTAALAIEKMDDLRDACTSQPQMMAKMSSIKRSMDADPSYAAAMTMQNLVDYVLSHPHIDIEIVGSAPNQRLVFDSKPSRRFQILKLLDDDFLRSVLTQREYDASSKVQTK